jgi:hypothetical protein
MGEHHALFHFHGDFHRHTRFCYRDRRGNRLARVPGSGISEEAQFSRDCNNHRIYMGNLALSMLGRSNSATLSLAPAATPCRFVPMALLLFVGAMLWLYIDPRKQLQSQQRIDPEVAVGVA